MVQECKDKLKNKRIAFYISVLQIGGAERVISNLANAFLENGYQVSMITDKPDPSKSYPLNEKVKRIILPELSGGVRIFNAIKRVTNLRKAVKESQAEVLVSFIGKSNLRAILATRFLKTKTVVSVRSAPGREYGTKLQRVLSRTLFRVTEGAVFQTRDAQAFFAKSVQKKSVVLMNPLNPDFIRPPYTGPRKQEIVTVGRLHKVKNHELLISAFARLADDYPQLVLRIYGGGEHESKLRPLIETAGLSKRVILEGSCSDVAKRILQSGIFVLSSDVEGMPNALLEAMALGIPCISTDCPCGGPRALIRDGENGLLVPVGDEAAMEQAMRRLLADEAFAARLGAQAALVQETLSPEKVNRMWMDYVEQL